MNPATAPAAMSRRSETGTTRQGARMTYLSTEGLTTYNLLSSGLSRSIQPQHNAGVFRAAVAYGDPTRRRRVRFRK